MKCLGEITEERPRSAGTRSISATRANGRANREEEGQLGAALARGFGQDGLDTRERTYGSALIIEADTGADAASIRRRYRARDARGPPIKYLEIINYTRRACTHALCTPPVRVVLFAFSSAYAHLPSSCITKHAMIMSIRADASA